MKACQVVHRVKLTVLSAFILSRLLDIHASTRSTHSSNAWTDAKLMLTARTDVHMRVGRIRITWKPRTSSDIKQLSNSLAVYCENNSGPSTDPCGYTKGHLTDGG